jgi:3-phosphoshikimate 1-carboxyvinyltransferase
MTSAEPQPMEFGPAGPLKGIAAVPGDKSISHRALMLAAMACGRSRIEGLSGGEDVLSTASALTAMGVRIETAGEGAVLVDGVGTGCLLQPQGPLDMGNSGTSARLLMGLVASHPVTATFIGDASLSRRPMVRVTRPLERMGANILAAPGDRLPLTIRGASPALALSYRAPVASAQVKSALLLAGLNAPGITEVIEPVPTRDHSERMLKWFGADLQVETGPQGERHIRLRGEAELRARDITVPGDFSAAAFLIVAALIVPGSELRIESVGINPSRTGLLDVLRHMGASISIRDERELGGEPVADIEVKHSRLSAVHVPAEAVPAMIDEFPAFFIAAAFAEGTSRARGLAELRVKESDRIAAMAAGLRSIGVDAEEQDEALAIHGSAGAPVPGGGTVDPRLDHRIAMSFAVAGLHAARAVTVADMSPVATSFPGFAAALSGLAAR